MENITITFPEVKVKITKGEFNFNILEGLVFEIIQQIGRKVLEKTLFDIDNLLRKERPKQRLKNLGKRGKYLMTRLGDVRYKRRRYEDRETGQIRYLLDEKIGIKKDQRISLARSKIEMCIANTTSYRGTKEQVELLTGCQRSHEAIRQSVIKEAESIVKYQESCFEKIRRLEDDAQAKEAAEIAYIESDDTVIKLQRSRKRKGRTKNKRRTKRSLSVKLGIGYTGRKQRYKKGVGKAKSLKDKFVYVGIEEGKKFMEKLSLIAEKRLNLSAVKHKFFGGDGAIWIKKGMEEYFPGMKYLLCLFHLMRNIKRALGGRKEDQRLVKGLIRADKIDEALMVIEGMRRQTRDNKAKESLEELHNYIRDNREGINAIRKIEDRQIRKQVEQTGGIEPNIGKVIAQRFKKRGMSWSKKGALGILKIKELIINGEWDEWWCKHREEKIEINKKKIEELSAKDFWKRNKETISLLEVNIPALRGPDQNEPWAKVIRELQKIDYYSDRCPVS